MNATADRDIQSSDDVIHEQDILRDPASSKPWLIYIDYKHQHGTLLEQAFVRWSISQAKGTELIYHLGTRESLQAAAAFLQTLEDGVSSSQKTVLCGADTS